MSKLVQQLKNMVTRDPGYSVKGPVVQDYRYIPEYEQYMYVLTFECAHGTRIPPEFGYFSTVEAVNSNKSKCTILLTGDEEEGVPVFAERCSKLTNVNEYICEATLCKQIVAADSDPEVGDDVWESNVTYIDAAHSMRETIKIVTQATITRSEFDPVLNADHPTVYTLTKTQPTEGLVGSVYTSYEKIKCGWYVKKTETISAGYSYTTSENYRWPAVLTPLEGAGEEEVFDFGELIGEDSEGTEFTAGILMHYDLKQAYNGPTKTDVAVTFSAAAPAYDADAPMVDNDIFYQGIFISFRLGSCLHKTCRMHEQVGSDHPRLKDAQVRNISWAATNYTDWPDSIKGEHTVRPHKGGFVSVKKTMYKPY